MRIIFMGSSEFACPALELILKTGRDEVVAVVSQPERPSGRRRRTKKCPVDEFVSRASIRTLTPENVNAPESIAALRALAPELIVVVAYGQILKSSLLKLPPQGCVNLHGSRLPQYRGAAPIQWAIARGERMTGVTTMFINEKMDGGDIILRAEERIAPDDTALSLSRRLAEKGAELLLESLAQIRDGRAPRIKQDESEVSYAPRLKKTDGRVDWIMPAKELSDRIRGFQPWPCCYFTLQAETARLASGAATVKILRARVEPGGGAEPGAVLETCGAGPLIQTGSGALRLLEVQPEGRKPMEGKAFLCGGKISRGEILA
ncbi:MAG: methionyl-tRNA formyltransferase [Kiritimatiellae bacterium]|nr:methionyl-tRNA formyltransferase [Kiritimatiellia bacterium]